MCTLRPFVALQDRYYSNIDVTRYSEDYEYFFTKFDIFTNDTASLNNFTDIMEIFRNYRYGNSIAIAFDGYFYLKDRYHFLLRTDIDVFLTPLFATWLPKNCDDFLLGRGGVRDVLQPFR